MIDPHHAELSVSRQCALLGLPRSSYYYEPSHDVSDDPALKNLIDEQYTQTPFYGVLRMTKQLQNLGFPVGEKRVRRLMREMGIMAIYPKPRLSISNAQHRKYPYLLADMDIARPDHVWCTDITYIRLLRGFVYLVAIMDWFSRYVLSWKLSITLDVDFCIEALDDAFRFSRPEIFNSDQGSQFTSSEFTNLLESKGVRISMDGRGRVFDNIFIERLWRSVKYEEVYVKNYDGVISARENLRTYFEFYNSHRLHQALDYSTPREVYFGLN
jgi:putative transposase